MKKFEYQVSFTTPAFLGNAEQQAQWRTPPFKALIRQWWRVVYAPKVNYDVARLRRDEAALFGSASEEAGAQFGKSRVLVKLDTWNIAAQQQLGSIGQVCHPEVDRGGPPCQSGPGRMIQSGLYLGYGPVTTQGNRSFIAHGAAGARLRIGLLESDEADLKTTLQLIAWLGTLGSRARNGWGSLAIEGEDIAPLTRDALNGHLRPLADCLRLDWPHAIGSDNRGPLVWKTQMKDDWREVMSELARIKITFRTALPLTAGHGPFQSRHLLAYPVTNHNVAVWGNKLRLANQMRFKVAKVNNQYLGLIAHLPCGLPAELAAKLQTPPAPAAQASTWQRIHAVMDSPTSGLTRL